MAKKSSASSRPGKRVSVSAASIWNKPLTKRQKDALNRIAQRQAAGDDSGIDFSDIPELGEEQLRSGRRPAKRLVAVRLDPDVLEWLQQYGEGYSSRINCILRAVMSQTRRLTFGGTSFTHRRLSHPLLAAGSCSGLQADLRLHSG